MGACSTLYLLHGRPFDSFAQSYRRQRPDCTPSQHVCALVRSQAVIERILQPMLSGEPVPADEWNAQRARMQAWTNAMPLLRRSGSSPALAQRFRPPLPTLNGADSSARITNNFRPLTSTRSTNDLRAVNRHYDGQHPPFYYTDDRVAASRDNVRAGILKLQPQHRGGACATAALPLPLNQTHSLIRRRRRNEDVPAARHQSVHPCTYPDISYNKPSHDCPYLSKSSVSVFDESVSRQMPTKPLAFS